jgi:hypothetical protein
VKQGRAGPNNTRVVAAQGTVNYARGEPGPAEINLSDTQQLGQEVVQAAQIALQTVLAAAQGPITADEARVGR